MSRKAHRPVLAFVNHNPIQPAPDVLPAKFLAEMRALLAADPDAILAIRLYAGEVFAEIAGRTR
jgi:hypothetical protein